MDMTTMPDMYESTMLNITAMPEFATTGGFKKERIAYVMFGCFGIIGNMFVIIVLGSKYEIRRKILNIFVINQSIVDFLSCLALLGHAVYYPSSKSVGIRGQFYCRLWYNAVILWSLYVTSTYIILGMTVERYLKIVYPFWYKKNYTKRYCFAGIAAAWLFGFGFNFALTIPTTVVEKEHCRSMSHWPSEAYSKAAGIITVAVELFIPLAILICCYGGIGVMLYRNLNTNSDNMAATGASKQRDKTIRAAYKNTIKALAFVAILYLICWTWNQIYFLMFNLGHVFCWCGPVYIIENLLVNAHSCLNPLIYAFTYNDFKMRVYEILGINQQADQSRNNTAPAITVARTQESPAALPVN